MIEKVPKNIRQNHQQFRELPTHSNVLDSLLMQAIDVHSKAATHTHYVS